MALPYTAQAIELRFVRREQSKRSIAEDRSDPDGHQDRIARPNC